MFPTPQGGPSAPKEEAVPPTPGRGLCPLRRRGSHSGISSHPCPSQRVQPRPQEKGVQDSLVSVQAQTSFNSRLFIPCRAVVPSL